MKTLTIADSLASCLVILRLKNKGREKEKRKITILTERTGRIINKIMHQGTLARALGPILEGDKLSVFYIDDGEAADDQHLTAARHLSDILTPLGYICTITPPPRKI